jgi:hypothetical protein
MDKLNAPLIVLASIVVIDKLFTNWQNKEKAKKLENYYEYRFTDLKQETDCRFEKEARKKRGWF